MIYTVTFNPSLDYVVFVDELNIGQIQRTDKYELIAGGKGINVSYVLKQLETDSIALGFVAGSTGESLKSMVREYGLNEEFIELGQGLTRINTKIRSNKNAKGYLETDINADGPVITDDEVNKLFDRLTTLDKNDVVIISGSVPKSISPEKYGQLVKLCSQNGVKVVVDVSGSYLAEALKGQPWLVKPNKEELEDFFDIDINDDRIIEDCALRLKESGASNVLVSLGDDGAMLFTEDGNKYRSDAPKGEVISTVGAGDSMVAGFVAKYLESQSMCEALKYGVASGSATSFLTGLAGKNDIEKLIGDIKCQ